MFRVDTKEIAQYEDDLKQFAAKAFPFATRKTINDAAFQTQQISRADISRSMTTRNTFTRRSILVNQSRTLRVSQQAATVGSIAGYMETQEFGGVKTKQGKEGVAIATSYSSGEGDNAQPRKRLPRRPNKMANIQLRNRRKKGGNRKMQNLIAIKQAAKTGRSFIFLDLGRKKGIFKVIGGARRPKIKMVHDLSNDSVRIPRNPWLKPATDEAARMLPAFYADALRFQLRRRGLFR